MQPLQVRAEASATANQSLSDAYLLLRDCTCGRRTRRSPTYAHHPCCAERHDRSMLQVPCSKRNVHHRVQKSPVVKAERYVGKERGRIDSIELRKEEKSDRLSNGKRPQNLQPSWPANSGRVSARVSLRLHPVARRWRSKQECAT
jgi:hypothetical protein